MKTDIDSPEYNDTNLGVCRMSSEEREIERLDKKVADLKAKLEGWRKFTASAAITNKGGSVNWHFDTMKDADDFYAFIGRILS